MALVQPLASGNVMTNGGPSSHVDLQAQASCPSSSGEPANHHQQQQQQAENEVEDVEEQHEVDIIINNVVCSFSVRCHLDLRYIAMNGDNVEYRRENGVSVGVRPSPYFSLASPLARRADDWVRGESVSSVSVLGACYVVSQRQME